MKDFDFYFQLNSCVEIFVPSTLNRNEHSADAEAVQATIVDHLISRFSEMFGGATVIDGVGGWFDGSNVIKESVKIVQAYCTAEQFGANLEKVVTLARKVCREMNQDAVTLRFNGQTAFISQN